jgi:hypothetical protein
MEKCFQMSIAPSVLIQAATPQPKPSPLSPDLPSKEKLNRNQMKKLKNVVSLPATHICLADKLRCSDPDCHTHLTKSERKILRKVTQYRFLSFD